jgi:hypothetical protein
LENKNINTNVISVRIKSDVRESSEDMNVIQNDVTAYYNKNGRILETPLHIYQKVNGKSVLFPLSLW